LGWDLGSSQLWQKWHWCERAARRLFIWAGLQSECYPDMAFHLLGAKPEPIWCAQPDCTADGCQEVIPLVKDVTMYC
jgi:hypothetical protein